MYRKLLFKSFLVFLVCTGFYSLAYIVTYKFMISRLANLQGRGTYQIENSLQVQGVLLKETWWISSYKKMFLQVEGRGHFKGKLFMNFYYSPYQLIFFNSDQKKSRVSLSLKRIEPIFHIRSTDKLLDRFAQIGIAPAKEKLKERSYKDFQPESFIKLTRLNNVISYKIGRSNSKGLWIEQDDFSLQKIKWSNSFFVVAKKFQMHTRSLYFPKERVVSVLKNKIEIKNLSVQALYSFPKIKLKKRQFQDEISLEQRKAIINFYEHYR